jgi:hypothetical protein
MNGRALLVGLLISIFAVGCDNAESAKPKLINATAAGDVATASSLVAKFPELAKSTDGNGVPLLLVAIDAPFPDIADSSDRA